MSLTRSLRRTNRGTAEASALWAINGRDRAGAGHPLAIEIFDSIEYPFREHFGKPNEAHALRALRFDDEVRRYVSRHPDATIVGLGEGLETGFRGVDNGRIRWLAVDLPEALPSAPAGCPTPIDIRTSPAQRSTSGGWTTSISRAGSSSWRKGC